VENGKELLDENCVRLGCGPGENEETFQINGEVLEMQRNLRKMKNKPNADVPCWGELLVARFLDCGRGLLQDAELVDGFLCDSKHVLMIAMATWQRIGKCTLKRQ
jgi:hypothetical protein